LWSPEILAANLEWGLEELRYPEVLRLLVSIPTSFKKHDKGQLIKNTTYALKSVVCHVGAHYLTFVRHDSGWLLQNDDKPIQELHSWYDVVLQLLSDDFKPILINYEKDQSGRHLKTDFKFDADSILPLYLLAKQKQDVMDQVLHPRNSQEPDFHYCDLCQNLLLPDVETCVCGKANAYFEEGKCFESDSVINQEDQNFIRDREPPDDDEERSNYNNSTVIETDIENTGQNLTVNQNEEEMTATFENLSD
jgi:hypothetical protein